METSLLPKPKTHALTQSHVSDPTYQTKRRKRRNDLVPIPAKWFKVVALHLSGVSTQDILKETGYSLGTYYQIMSNPRTQAVRQQLLGAYQDEFEALFGTVISNLRKQLMDDSLKVQQEAQRQWLAAESKFKIVKNKATNGDSAEDLVSKLLNLNVQVNVNNDAK